MPAATDDEMRSVLAQAVAAHCGVARTITALSRRESPYRTSFSLEDVEITLDDESRILLVFKALGRDDLSVQAQAVKPLFLHDPMREIEVYRLVVPRIAPGPPRCYASVADADRRRYWLFLEKVPGVELYQVGQIETWRVAARWLAGFHASAARIEWPADLRLRVVCYDDVLLRTWITRAMAAVRTSGRQAAVAGALAALSRSLNAIAQRWRALPHTFIHGEFYASNVLVDADSARVSAVDWEMAGFGPALLDLAALVAGDWTESDRAAIAAAYYDAAVTSGWWSPSRAEFDDALGLARLYTAVQWLGWAQKWRPPAEHQYDWASDIVELTRRFVR